MGLSRNFAAAMLATVVGALAAQADASWAARGALEPSISADGRYVAFIWDAQAYVRDLRTGKLRLASRATGVRGHPSKYGGATLVEISANGRFVVFVAVNLDPVGKGESVYVRDLRRNRTTLVSRATGAHGADANYAGVLEPHISGDGRRVMWTTNASNLSPEDRSRNQKVFVRDLVRKTTRLASGGMGGNNAGGYDISRDGRYVIFESAQPDINGDIPGMFVRDMTTGTTELVSRGPNGVPAEGTFGGSLSGDGRLVAFVTTNDFGGTPTNADVYVRDRATQTTTLESPSSGPPDPDGALGADLPLELSDDGKVLVFYTEVPGFDPADSDRLADVFAWNLETNTTTLVSRASGSGPKGNGHSTWPSVSANGRYVAFDSRAKNLAPGDKDRGYDVFVRDLVTGKTTLVSGGRPRAR